MIKYFYHLLFFIGSYASIASDVRESLAYSLQTVVSNETNEEDNDLLIHFSSLKISNDPVKKKYRRRLFLGESDFSCAVSLLKKHLPNRPQLGNFITATELESENYLKATYQFFENNKTFLNEIGVEVLCNVDAQEIHDYFKGRLYPRIHFNFPHDKSNFKDQTLPPILARFFLSSSKLQEINDRIYVALAQPSGKAEFYQGYVYNIYDAAYKAGYELFKKRASPLERYPGYQHRQTGHDSPVKAAYKAKEFIFIKKYLPIKDKQPVSPKRKMFYKEWRNCIPDMDTDNDSSNYSSLSSSSDEGKEGDH